MKIKSRNSSEMSRPSTSLSGNIRGSFNTRIPQYSANSRPGTIVSIFSIKLLTKNANNLTISPKKESLSRSIDRNTPIVTSKSWSIYNLKKGSLLLSKSGQELREVASLTKIMTALTALSLSEHFNIDLPNTFTEVSTYAHMVGTIGTNADLRKGEKISIENLFYALLVPSGNDAAIVMAEYFGGLLLKSKNQAMKECYTPNYYQGAYHYMHDVRIKAFIKAMNKLSKRLCLKHTIFNNPHGLSDKGNKSTSEEIGKLACFFMQYDFLVKISNTKKYVTQITSKIGVEREVTWINTNKMLDIPGYSGIKTGSTPNAGPCLCVVYTQNNTPFVLTILGANSSEHRWIEIDRLAKWACVMLQDKQKYSV